MCGRMAEETRKKAVRHSAAYYRRRAESLERQAKVAKAMAERKAKREYEARAKRVRAYRASPAHRRKVLGAARERERMAGRSGNFSLRIFPGKPKKRRKAVRRPPPRRPRKKA